MHETGELTKATEMFGRLGDPNGANNALSQVLYGLALRHGWGVEKDESKAVMFLSAAASNSGAIEEEALKAGMKKGGQAKGELTLAIFGLANCFRNGWCVVLPLVLMVLGRGYGTIVIATLTLTNLVGALRKTQ